MLRELSRRQEALLAYDELVRLDPQSAKPWVGKAWVLVDLKRYEEALDAFDHALQLAPSLSTAVSGKRFILEHLWKLFFLTERGRYADGLATCERCLEYNPQLARAHERQEWSGTAKQFKEILCQHSPDAFATWYRSPREFVDELKESAPALLDEGIAASVPPDTALVTLSKMATERLQHPK